MLPKVTLLETKQVYGSFPRKLKSVDYFSEIIKPSESELCEDVHVNFYKNKNIKYFLRNKGLQNICGGSNHSSSITNYRNEEGERIINASVRPVVRYSEIKEYCSNYFNHLDFAYVNFGYYPQERCTDICLKEIRFTNETFDFMFMDYNLVGKKTKTRKKSGIQKMKKVSFREAVSLENPDERYAYDEETNVFYKVRPLFWFVDLQADLAICAHLIFDMPFTLNEDYDYDNSLVKEFLEECFMPNIMRYYGVYQNTNIDEIDKLVYEIRTLASLPGIKDTVDSKLEKIITLYNKNLDNQKENIKLDQSIVLSLNSSVLVTKVDCIIELEELLDKVKECMKIFSKDLVMINQCINILVNDLDDNSNNDLANDMKVLKKLILPKLVESKKEEFLNKICVIFSKELENVELEIKNFFQTSDTLKRDSEIAIRGQLNPILYNINSELCLNYGDSEIINKSEKNGNVSLDSLIDSYILEITLLKESIKNLIEKTGIYQLNDRLNAILNFSFEGKPDLRVNVDNSELEYYMTQVWELVKLENELMVYDSQITKFEDLKHFIYK